jgi:hypothetical protein
MMTRSPLLGFGCGSIAGRFYHQHNAVRLVAEIDAVGVLKCFPACGMNFDMVRVTQRDHVLRYTAGAATPNMMGIRGWLCFATKDATPHQAHDVSRWPELTLVPSPASLLVERLES